MDPFDVLTVALSSLVMLIVIHLAVFGVIRTMYPPATPVQQVRFAEPIAVAAPPASPPFTQSSTLPFTEPVHVKQEVNVPTYAPPVPVEAPREDGLGELGKPSGTAAERPAWLVAVDPKTLDT